MLAIRSIVLSKSKPWNMLWLKCCALREVEQRVLVLAADEPSCLHQEAGRPAGRVADLVVRTRRRHLDHEPDDVPRRAELAVLPSRGDLAEHVLVDVALGVLLAERDVGR